MGCTDFVDVIGSALVGDQILIWNRLRQDWKDEANVLTHRHKTCPELVLLDAKDFACALVF